tara:strand:+ start:800 stop:1915 length:1116 start_codon:yes stop_codon:yes gene_type:complete
MKKLLIIIGTRPELIKLFPIYKILKSKKKYSVKVCFTGQHEELIHKTNNIFKIKMDFSFKKINKKNNLNILSSNIYKNLNEVFISENPNLIVVQGDTTTTMVSAICAFNLQIPIAYLESGLRTYNLNSPFPEEANRQIISRISSINFCPTIQNLNNLKNEKVYGLNYLVGNTVIDSINFILRNYKSSKKEVFSKLKIRDKYHKFIVITAHRRENFGSKYINILKAIEDISENNPKVLIIFISHPNPLVQKMISKYLKKAKNIILSNNLNYVEFINLLKHSYFVISDSGGIQEEISILNKPLLMIRDTTERSEGIKSGFIKKVGTNKSKIVNTANILLKSSALYKSMINKKSPFGDGKSSIKIEKIISNFLG